eukprot:761421-Hanusia_phi.AAC.1
MQGKQGRGGTGGGAGGGGRGGRGRGGKRVGGEAMKREREGDVVVMETVLDLSPKKRKREALSELFRTYSKNGGEMDLEGFIRLGQDLSSSDEEASSPEHTAFLFFLSYKMGCERFGHLQLDHFVRVSESLKCFHVEDFKAKKKEMLKEAAKNFEQLYPYVFDILQPEAKKYVEKDMAILALQVASSIISMDFALTAVPGHVEGDTREVFAPCRSVLGVPEL